MYSCALFDYKNIYSSNYDSVKGDFIEDFISKHNIDIIFITNYVNHSLYIDIEDYKDNVFYSNIDGKYYLYKGNIVNNVCNAILVSVKYPNFVKTNYILDDFSLQPLILYDNVSKTKLICFDETNISFNKVNNYKCILKRLFWKNIYTIIAGSFKKNDNINKYDNKLLSFCNNHYGILFKNFNNIEFETHKSKYFDRDILTFFCLENNSSMTKYYFNKFIHLFTFG